MGGRSKVARPDAMVCPLAEGVARTGIQPSVARRFVDNGTWRSFRINNRIYVYPDEIKEWIAAQAGKVISTIPAFPGG
jgi:hypothetical protein